MHHYTKFTYKIFGDSDDILQTNILDMLTFTVTLTLNAVLQHFHKTLWLMMMYHQTKCGWKRISDTVETVIDLVKFCCDLDLEHSNQIYL